MIRRGAVINYGNIAKGLFIFSIGLFKKILIADSFAVWATAGFDSSAAFLNLFEAWATSLSYTFQLYFDFSGYTDMAIGLSLMFNIKLPINFNSPYKATDIQDFWRRWHITLSRFLRDYVYFPLGGSREGNIVTYSNLMVTFLIGGIWHGAGWTFIFWGFLHGLALVIHRIWTKTGFKLWAWLAWLVTFNFINITWVFFRANDWDSITTVLGGMFSLHHIVLPTSLANKLLFLKEYSVEFGGFVENINGGLDTIFWLFMGLISVLLFKNSLQMLEGFRFNKSNLVFTSITFVWGIISLNKLSEFLYFNF